MPRKQPLPRWTRQDLIPFISSVTIDPWSAGSITPWQPACSTLRRRGMSRRPWVVPELSRLLRTAGSPPAACTTDLAWTCATPISRRVCRPPWAGANRGPIPGNELLKLRFSAAPKGPKQESPGGGNPACGVGPGDSMRMSIHPALKGRNKTRVHTLVVPFQGVAILTTRYSSQDVALGWHVAAPSGRDARSVTPKGVSPGVRPGTCREAIQKALKGRNNLARGVSPGTTDDATTKPLRSPGRATVTIPAGPV